MTGQPSGNKAPGGGSLCPAAGKEAGESPSKEDAGFALMI